MFLGTHSRHLLFLPLSPTLSSHVPHIPCRFFFSFNFPEEVKDLQSTIEALRSFHFSDLSSLRNLIDERDELILREESNLTAIGLYFNHIEERLSSFVVARRNILHLFRKVKRKEKAAGDMRDV